MWRQRRRKCTTRVCQLVGWKSNQVSILASYLYIRMREAEVSLEEKERVKEAEFSYRDQSKQAAWSMQRHISSVKGNWHKLKLALHGHATTCWLGLTILIDWMLNILDSRYSQYLMIFCEHKTLEDSFARNALRLNYANLTLEHFSSLFSYVLLLILLLLSSRLSLVHLLLLITTTGKILLSMLSQTLLVFFLEMKGSEIQEYQWWHSVENTSKVLSKSYSSELASN